MKNFRNSDYARNKVSTTAIVYSFVDGSGFEYTLEEYLAEFPGKTPDDFRFWKDWSDRDLKERDRKENAQTKKNAPLDDADMLGLCRAPSVEDVIGGEDMALEFDLNRQSQLSIADSILDKLTETQRRRFRLYTINQLGEKQIADLESTTQQAISKSLLGAKKKIKKILAQC